MTQAVDLDPYDPAHQEESTLGGRQEPDNGDPTAGGKRGEIGTAGSVAADEPADGGPAIPVGGGKVTEEADAAPVADPGADE